MKKIGVLFCIAVIYIFCIVVSVVAYKDVSLLTLEYFNKPNIAGNTLNIPIVKDRPVRGEFVAKENNLGVVGLRIRTFNRINNDILVFRMREKGKMEWKIYNKYFTDRFPDDTLYPFGFPVISNSKGRVYEYEVLSINGTKDNAVGLGSLYPQFVTRYIFNRREVFSGFKSAVDFLQSKFLNYFSNLYLFAFSVILFTNIILILKLLVKGKVRKVNIFLNTVLFALLYTTFPFGISDYVTLIFMGIVLYFGFRRYVTSSDVYIFIALLLATLWLCYLVGWIFAANKLSILVYLYSLVAFILFIHKEIKKK